MSGEDELRPAVPRPLTFDGGVMTFEQLVSVEVEQRSPVPIRDVHINHGRKIAARNGYRFNGEGVVERFETSDPGDIVIYRLTVPVVADRGGGQ